MARGEGLEPPASALIADVLPIGLSTKNKEHHMLLIILQIRRRVNSALANWAIDYRLPYTGALVCLVGLEPTSLDYQSKN